MAIHWIVAIVDICNLTNFYVTQVICHLHTSHILCTLFAPQILHNLCFSFLLHITVVPREIENNAYAKFWGAKKVHKIWEMQCKSHIKRNSKLNLMLLASNLYISHLDCMLNNQLIFNILGHLWMASLKLYLQFKFTK